MSKKEKLSLDDLRNQAIEVATKEAADGKLNEEQTKLLVEDAIAKVEKEYERSAKTEENKTNDIKEKKTVEKAEKEYVVKTPVKNYCGEVAGVQFAYGKANVQSGWILEWFREHGYEIEVSE